jgi:hypothetical protein
MGRNCILRVQFHPPQNSAKVYPNDTCSPSRTNKTRRARHASHGDPAIYDQEKNILKGKDELSKVNYVTMQKSTLQKILEKKAKSFQPL